MRKHHFTVLLAFDEHGPSSQVTLGRRLCIESQRPARRPRRPRARGLYRARVRDEQDRRRNVVELTGAGARTLERLEARLEAAQKALLAPLSAGERRELCRSLTRLADHHAAGPPHPDVRDTPGAPAAARGR